MTYLVQFSKMIDINGNKRINYSIVDDDNNLLDTGSAYSKNYLLYTMEDYDLKNENLKDESDLLFAEEVQ